MKPSAHGSGEYEREVQGGERNEARSRFSVKPAKIRKALQSIVSPPLSHASFLSIYMRLVLPSDLGHLKKSSFRYI